MSSLLVAVGGYSFARGKSIACDTSDQYLRHFPIRQRANFFSFFIIVSKKSFIHFFMMFQRKILKALALKLGFFYFPWQRVFQGLDKSRHFRDEMYGTVKRWGCTVWGRIKWGRNVQGRIVLVSWSDITGNLSWSYVYSCFFCTFKKILYLYFNCFQSQLALDKSPPLDIYNKLTGLKNLFLL